MQWPVVFEGAKIVLDALAAASWPIAVTGLAIGFRRPIVRAIDRLKAWKAFGNEAELSALPPPQHGSSSVAEPSTALAKGPPNQPLPANPVWEHLDRELLDYFSALQGVDADTKLAWAIRLRSVSEAERLHEANYRNIYGSQIQALQTLRLVGQTRADHFKAFYDKAANNPEWGFAYEGRSFERWGQFILSTGYVRLVDGTEPTEVELTPFGEDFVNWMHLRRVPETKPG